ncbi:MAG: cytochrome c oxidase assembly protein [Sphingobacteriaceae bacterium]|nr:MAG: cytochrome c oxidase assembly protein [Sphingobacteriaceae bacterium]
MEMKPLIYEWHFSPLIILFLAVLLFLYYKLSGFKQTTNNTYFALAILLFLLADCSPLHFLGMHYYFSAHMIAHVVLLLICGPLLVLSIPAKTPAPFKNSLSAFSKLLSKYSWIAWLTGVLVMWFWHIPAIFDASFISMNKVTSIVPLLHAGSMLLAGAVFSWPILGPDKKLHVHPLAGIVYLFTACVSCSILGLLITFAPLTTYQHYADGFASMAGSNPWHITQLADQQAAGLIMWVPCCFVYLSGCLYLLQRWFTDTGYTNEKSIDLTTVIHHE